MWGHILLSICFWKYSWVCVMINEVPKGLNISTFSKAFYFKPYAVPIFCCI